MKKTLLAVAIPTLLIANTANAYELINEEGKFVDFYGQLRTQLEKKEDKDVTLNAGSSRAGVNAKYAVNEDLDVVGSVEFGVGYSEGSYDIKNRLHFAGFATQAGTFTFGRQWISTDDVWGADYSYFFGGTGIGQTSEKLSGGRHDSAIKYKFEGENFWVNSTFGLSEDDTNAELGELYVGTTVAGFNVHAGGGYYNDKSYKVGSQTVGQDQAGNDVKKDIKADIESTYFEATVERSFGPALVGLSYNNGSFEQNGTNRTIDVDSFMLATSYSIASNASLYGGYEFTNFDAEDGTNSLSDDYTVIYLGGVYHLNSWSRVYAEYGYADGATLGYKNDEANINVARGVKDAENSFAVGYRVYW
ncbi:porin [Photobacterium sp. WH24]|uniref:Porin n=1 Tax=Photobacterium arenosum TaxID=2774143 RepID=A0ABR9BJH8_9GAMM|nr:MULTISPECIES: porin [Photobacterium]MBD8512344.1 porin [Photobacterium arenosum]MBV7260705.1 porin [Photobacterium sp. WH24]